MNKKTLALLFFLVFLGGFVFYIKNISKQKNDIVKLQDFKDMPDRQIKNIKIGKKNLKVEVVNTDASRSLGLSGRDMVGGTNPEVNGMLFVFPQKTYQSFWMKDMKFNLDFIWISDGRVVEIMKDVLKPDADQSLKDLPKYIPKTTVEMMLEVESGNVDKWDVKVGDEVVY